MARIIYSGLVDSIRGSIGGTTFQKNAYGYTVKKKPNMVRPNTSFQQQHKIYFAQAVRAWAALTSGQRANWDSWSSTFPQYSRFNPSSQLSGFAVFVRVHVYRLIAGQPVLVSPTFVVNPTVTVTISLEIDGAIFRLVETDDDGSEAFFINLNLSHQFSGSQNFIGTKTRFITAFTSAGADEIDITAAYTQYYGAIPSVGQRIAWRAVIWGDVNGVVQAPIEGIFTVIAHV